MTVTDTIADALTIIRNGALAGKEAVEIKKSSLCENIMGILKREGFIENHKTIDDNKQGLIKVYLKYDKDKSSALTGLKRISKPGLRVYVAKKEIKRVYGGIGIAIISTSQGLMTDKEAREKSIGGEILCQAW